MSVSPEQVVENRSNLEINMYRGKSRYAGADTGAPDHSEENAIPDSDTRVLIQLYQNPQKVNSSCSVFGVDTYNSSNVAHNCPTEQGASGSSGILNINNKNYLVGIHTMASSNNFDSSKHAGGSTMLTSDSFCADYQTACGKPCIPLSDELLKLEQRVY